MEAVCAGIAIKPQIQQAMKTYKCDCGHATLQQRRQLKVLVHEQLHENAYHQELEQQCERPRRGPQRLGDV